MPAAAAHTAANNHPPVRNRAVRGFGNDSTETDGAISLASCFSVPAGEPSVALMAGALRDRSIPLV
jgi:hypothetical protein